MDTVGEYTKKKVIGRGGFARVHLAVNNQTGKKAALKELRFGKKGQGIPNYAIGEIACLKELKHPNIVCLENVIFQPPKALYLVLEYMEMDLRKYLDTLPQGKMIDHEVLKSYTYQILQGTEFCHSKGIIHGDLKPENLLVGQGGIIKLTDFGIARMFAMPFHAYSSVGATLWYRAPEDLLGSNRHCFSRDLWSVGCVYAEMVTKKAIFRGANEKGQLYQIFMLLGTPDQAEWPGILELPKFSRYFPNWVPQDLTTICPTFEPLKDGCDLLKQMLVYNPRNRISASAALLHPYFKNFDQAKCPLPGSGTEPEDSCHPHAELTPPPSNEQFQISHSPSQAEH